MRWREEGLKEYGEEKKAYPEYGEEKKAWKQNDEDGRCLENSLVRRRKLEENGEVKKA